MVLHTECDALKYYWQRIYQLPTCPWLRWLSGLGNPHQKSLTAETWAIYRCVLPVVLCLAVFHTHSQRVGKAVNGGVWQAMLHGLAQLSGHGTRDALCLSI